MAWTVFRFLVLTVLCFRCSFASGTCQFYDGIKQDPSPPAAVPSQLRLPQQTTTGLASLDVTDPTINGTRTAFILQSITQQFHLVLQLQDVGKESFCWVAVLDVVTRWELAWRAPCQPVRTKSCCLRFTDRGDLQLFLPDSETVAWRTNTTDLGAKVIRILDNGNWLLLRARTDIVWQTSQYPVPQECLIPGPVMIDNASVYTPPSPAGSRETTRAGSLLAAAFLVNFVIILLVF